MASLEDLEARKVKYQRVDNIEEYIKYPTVCVGALFGYEKLERERFETCISVATSQKDMCLIFQTNLAGLDDFCLQEYDSPFDVVYKMILRDAVDDYKDALRALAKLGNATAMNTINQIVLDTYKQQDMNVTIYANIPKEEKKNESNIKDISTGG